MTMKEMEKRLAVLEAEVRDLRTKLAGTEPTTRSVLDLFGKYQDDPVFEEATRLGREWREDENRKSLEEFDGREPAKTRKKNSRANDRKPRKADARR